MSLAIVPASGELLAHWRAVHNAVIPPVQLTAVEVAESAARNDLTVAYSDGVLVGNATVRAPRDGVVIVIVRILSEHRRHGLGGEYLQAVLEQARTSPAEQISTVVFAGNVDGLAFATRHGFVETERYGVDGVAFVDLTLRNDVA